MQKEKYVKVVLSMAEKNILLDAAKVCEELADALGEEWVDESSIDFVELQDALESIAYEDKFEYEKEC